jgi:hypothetical protein
MGTICHHTISLDGFIAGLLGDTLVRHVGDTLGRHEGATDDITTKGSGRVG